MNCEQIEQYKNELETSIVKTMAYPINERSTAAVDSMVQCWKNITELQEMVKKDFKFTPQKAEKWLLNMENEDGTKGPHWSIDQTNSLKPAGISDYVWECALNMVYSDYYKVAVEHKVDTPKFYVDMAKAFLMDKDAKGPEQKIAAYYNCIVDVE